MVGPSSLLPHLDSNQEPSDQRNGLVRRLWRRLVDATRARIDDLATCSLCGLVYSWRFGHWCPVECALGDLDDPWACVACGNWHDPARECPSPWGQDFDDVVVDLAAYRAERTA